MPKFNLYRKMLLILIVMLIPIIGLYVYSNYVSSNILREELQNSNRDQLSFFQQQMDNTIHTVSQWPNLLIYDPDISTLKDMPNLAGNYLNLDTIELVKRIQKKLSIQENSVNWASQLTVYSPSLGRKITSSDVEMIGEDQINETSQRGWKTITRETTNNDKEYVFLLHTVSPFSSTDSPDRSNIIMEVKFDSSNIIAMLDSFRGDGQRNPFYYVKEDEVIYHSHADRQLVNELITKLNLQDVGRSAYDTVTIENENYLVNMERSTTTGWVLIDYIPLSDMMLPIKKSNMLFYASVVTLLLMAAVVIYMLYVQVQVPIKQLVTSFQRVKKEDYSVRLKPKGNSEFAFLFNRFNSMVTQIQDLFQRSYLEQIHIREAKLKQLQSQINPHFFYNCFSFITSMAKMQNYNAVVAMAQNLSHYYRYTTRQERELVTLQEEITFVRHYLDISVMRMNRLSYQIELPEELKDIMIPPLAIQPLVENAILHGIEQSRSAGFVKIEIRCIKNKVIVSVDDDGKGMNEADIVSLTRRLNYPMQEDMGCGLWNVHQRLLLRYGGQSGIQIQPSKMGGLNVTLSWPIAEEDITNG